MKKCNPFLKILAVLVGGVLGYAVVASMFGAGRYKSSVDAQLAHAADELNGKRLSMSDSEIRLDKVTAGPGEKMTYAFTVLNQSKSGMDLLAFQKYARQYIINGNKTNVLRKLNVTLEYQYKDTNGESIADIIVTPKDF
jgi:hypothetical protein